MNAGVSGDDHICLHGWGASTVPRGVIAVDWGLKSARLLSESVAWPAPPAGFRWTLLSCNMFGGAVPSHPDAGCVPQPSLSSTLAFALALKLT
jgi:hypothetical protein